MTETVQVTVTEIPVSVKVTDNTPIVTVTDLDSLAVTVIDASPQVNISVDQQPQVTVHIGTGGVYDLLTLLRMLEGALTLTQFEATLAANLNQAITNSTVAGMLATLTDAITTSQLTPTLRADIEKLQALWSRIGIDPLLPESDIVALLADMRAILEGLITTTAAELTATMEAQDAVNAAAIDQVRSDLTSNLSMLETTLSSTIQDNTYAIDVLRADTAADVLALTNSIDSEIAAVIVRIEQTETNCNDQIALLDATLSAQVASNLLEIRAIEAALEQDILDVYTELDVRISAATTPIWDNLDSLNLWRSNFTVYVEDTFGDHWAQILLTAEEISLQVGALEESINGQLITMNAAITMNAEEINLRVDQVEYNLGEEIAAYTGLISVTAHDIWLLTQRVIDVEDGLITAESSITLNADEILLRVSEISALDGRILANESEISIQAGVIGLLVTQTDSLEGRIDTAEINISATEGIVSSMTTTLANQGYRISATETLLTNHWGVEIVEDVSGVQYVAGVKLIQYPQWLVDQAYTSGTTVYYEGEVYECNTGHTSSSDNSPPSSVWTLLPDGVKSEFIVKADSFRILGTGGDEQTIDDFVSTITSSMIGEDGVTVTWFYAVDPTLSNAPYNTWTTTEERDRHVGDIYFNTLTGATFGFQKSGSTYYWTEIYNEDLTQALSDAAIAQDTADQKRRTFISTPYPPYDVGDLWAQGSGGDVYVCILARASGSYSADDWGLASKYTDDSALSSFISATYDPEISNLEGLIDGKIYAWFQDTDPVGTAAWVAGGSNASHEGDMWWHTTANQLRRYSGSSWSSPITDATALAAYTIAADAEDLADSKRRTFVSTPYPPYDVGDLWTQGAAGDMYVCVLARSSGSYSASDWSLASKYTDNSALDSFISATYNVDIADLTTAIDGKIYTWFQDSDPVGSAAWVAGGSNASHEGDMWWHTTNNQLRRYSGSSWSSPITDATALAAYGLAEDAEDLADQKRRVFVSTPYAPYDVGDLWDRGSTLGIWRCVTALASGSYSLSHWQVVADTTGNNTAYDTAYVNSVAAAQLTLQAARGNSVYLNAGSLAYLDALETVAQLGDTIISGGYIKTELIKTADVIVANDIVGTMTFTSTGKIIFASSRNAIYGDSSVLYLTGSAGLYNISSGNLIFSAGTSNYMYYQFNRVNKIYMTQYGMFPSGSIVLGSSSARWSAVHTTAVYRDGTALDDFDDLYELSKISPRQRKVYDEKTKEVVAQEDIKNPKINMAYIDPFSVPQSLTNYTEVVETLKRDNCDLITDEDIEEWLQDYDEAGWMLQIDLGLFTDLTAGGLRQLDREVIEMFSLMAERITTLERQVAALETPTKKEK
jgi:hypothetical protein